MPPTSLRFAPLWLAPAFVAGAAAAPLTPDPFHQDPPAPAEAGQVADEEQPVQIHYIEIVTPDVDATCRALAAVHGVEFGEPVPELGQARTAPLDGGGSLGVRAPLRDTEEPVVRPYALVDDVAQAVEAAAANGGEVALPPTEIPRRGTFAIYVQGGIDHGLWEL